MNTLNIFLLELLSSLQNDSEVVLFAKKSFVCIKFSFSKISLFNHHLTRIWSQSAVAAVLAVMSRVPFPRKGKSRYHCPAGVTPKVLPGQRRDIDPPEHPGVSPGTSTDETYQEFLLKKATRKHLKEIFEPSLVSLDVEEQFYFCFEGLSPAQSFPVRQL